MQEEINPFDLLSGKVVQNDRGTFYFKEPGVNVWDNGSPISNRLHRVDGPAVIRPNLGGYTTFGLEEWWLNGKRHRLDGKAVIYAKGKDADEWWVDGYYCSRFDEFITMRDKWLRK